MGDWVDDWVDEWVIGWMSGWVGERECIKVGWLKDTTYIWWLLTS